MKIYDSYQLLHEILNINEGTKTKALKLLKQRGNLPSDYPGRGDLKQAVWSSFYKRLKPSAKKLADTKSLDYKRAKSAYDLGQGVL